MNIWHFFGCISLSLLKYFCTCCSWFNCRILVSSLRKIFLGRTVYTAKSTSLGLRHSSCLLFYPLSASLSRILFIERLTLFFFRIQRMTDIFLCHPCLDYWLNMASFLVWLMPLVWPTMWRYWSHRTRVVF